MKACFIQVAGVCLSGTQEEATLNWTGGDPMKELDGFNKVVTQFQTEINEKVLVGACDEDGSVKYDYLKVVAQVENDVRFQIYFAYSKQALDELSTVLETDSISFPGVEKTGTDIMSAGIKRQPLLYDAIWFRPEPDAKDGVIFLRSFGINMHALQRDVLEIAASRKGAKIYEAALMNSRHF